MKKTHPILMVVALVLISVAATAAPPDLQKMAIYEKNQLTNDPCGISVAPAASAPIVTISPNARFSTNVGSTVGNNSVTQVGGPIGNKSSVQTTAAIVAEPVTTHVAVPLITAGETNTTRVLGFGSVDTSPTTNVSAFNSAATIDGAGSNVLKMNHTTAATLTRKNPF